MIKGPDIFKSIYPPGVFFKGSKNFCLKNKGSKKFSIFFKGCQISWPILDLLFFSWPKICEIDQFKKSDSYSKKKPMNFSASKNKNISYGTINLVWRENWFPPITGKEKSARILSFRTFHVKKSYISNHYTKITWYDWLLRRHTQFWLDPRNGTSQL